MIGLFSFALSLKASIIITNLCRKVNCFFYFFRSFFFCMCIYNIMGYIRISNARYTPFLYCLIRIYLS